MSADSDAACAQYKKKWARPSCFECRKSKRRCDSLLPKCSRCESLGLDCEYKIAAETKAETVRPTVAAAHTPAAQQPPSDAPQDDAGVLWISSTLLLDSSSVRRLLYQGMRAIDWPEWLNSQNDAQLEHTIFKLHDPELPVISLLQMIVLIKGVSAAFPVPKLTIASCVRVCNSLVQSIEQEMRALPSRISARMCSKNRSFETAAGLVPWMTVLLTESGILGDALSSLHTRLLRLSNTVVCFFFAKPIDAKVSPLTSSAKRSRTAQLGPDADDSVTCATSASISDASFFTSNPFTALTNALSRPWAVLSRMATTVVSQASDQYRLAISNMMAPSAADGLLHADSSASSLTPSDLDQMYMEISACADIDDASKCWYQIFVDCAKYLLCFRDSQHERAQAHIADATKSISLLRAMNLSSVPAQIVPCFKSVVACCHSRITQLGQVVAPVSLVRPLKAGSGVAAEDHVKQLLPMLLGHVARIIGTVASIVATNASHAAFLHRDHSELTRSCFLLQLQTVQVISESPPSHTLFSNGNQSDDGTRSPIHLLSLLSSSPQLRCRSPSVASVGGGGDWELHSSGNADDALDVNEYLMDDIYDCSSAVGIAATEGGSLLSSWWGAAAAAVSSTVANVAAQPLVESNILHFLQSDDSR